MDPRHADASDLPSLPRGDPDKTARIAEQFTLQDRVTSARVRWKPTDEQRTVWRLMALWAWLFIAKSRKIGTSTAGEFDDLMWTNAADRTGNRVRTVFAIDTDPKAQEHLDRCEDFADQKKMACRVRRSSGQYSIRFPRGAHLDFLTLGGDEPGRGGDIHRLHVTELPYAANPERAWHSLRSACADNARGLIETTMTSADAFTVDLWRGSRRDAASRRTVPIGTEFKRHFFSVEEHKSYRAPTLEEDAKRSVHLLPSKDETGKWRTGELTTAEWEYCRTQGFKLREAAAWWWLHALPNLCGGDLLTLMHDYPQIEPHLFVAVEGRAIVVDPQVAPVVDTVYAHGITGQKWALEVYVKPAETSGQHVITVDTAFAKGKSNSVVLVVDLADGRICACFCSPLVETDDLARVAQLAKAHYLEGKGKRRVDVVIEDDGIGDETCKDATKLGLAHSRFNQANTTTKYGGGACVKAAKRRIETLRADDKSAVAGPVELVDEVQKLKKTEAGFEGYKDVVMCLGMAEMQRQTVGMRNADEEWKKQRKDINRVFVEDRMREERMRWRGHDVYGRRI